jgi:hypothetical protein
MLISRSTVHRPIECNSLAAGSEDTRSRLSISSIRERQVIINKHGISTSVMKCRQWLKCTCDENIDNKCLIDVVDGFLSIGRDIIYAHFGPLPRIGRTY